MSNNDGNIVKRSSQYIDNLGFNEDTQLKMIEVGGTDGATTNRLKVNSDGSINVTGGTSGGDGHTILGGTDAEQKDDTFYGDGLTTGIASIAKRNFNGTSYDRDWGQTQTRAYSISAVSDDGTYKYFYFEDASLNYYIMRKHKANKVFTYTKGTGGYSAVYVSSSAGPSGSPTWATYGNTF